MRWRVLMACAAAVAVVFAAPGVHAQRGVSGTAQNEGGSKWAVVIGVGEYPDPALADLPNAVRDARAMYEALVSEGGLFPADNVILLTDDASNPLHTPTRSNILATVGGWVEQAKEEDSVLVYFAGHGVEADGKLYLMPQDGRSNTVEMTAIAYSDFETLLERSSARLSLVILDACHSGVGRGQSAMTREMAAELDAYSEGRILLASCKEDEVSHEMEGEGHGAFTWYLLEGLGGGADANGDAAVSAKELSDYTFEQVSRWSRRNQLRQTPRLKADISGDFVLAQVAAGEGRPESPSAQETTLAAAPPEAAAAAADGARKRFSDAFQKPEANSDYQEGRRLLDAAAEAAKRGDQSKATELYRQAEERFEAAAPEAWAIVD